LNFFGTGYGWMSKGAEAVKKGSDDIGLTRSLNNATDLVKTKAD